MKLYKLRIFVLLSRQGKKIAITSGIHYLHLNFVVDKTPPSQGFKQPRRTPLGFFGWPIRSGFSLVLKCECITLFAALDNGGGWWDSPVSCPEEFQWNGSSQTGATTGHLFSLATSLGHFSLTQVQKFSRNSEDLFACSRAVCVESNVIMGLQLLSCLQVM